MVRVESLQGQLLIASPSLLDPNFRRTVVLVIEHNDDGAAGIVLNRPSDSRIAEAVPQLEALGEPEEPVFVGGPVEGGAVVVLAEFTDGSEPAVPVLGDAIGFAALDEEAEEIASVTNRRRVFAGYAGWGAGQLEDELAREDWILEPAHPDDVFADDPESMWSSVLHRKGGVYELVARMPEDPSLN
jgi:putative transcriptional regulator